MPMIQAKPNKLNIKPIINPTTTKINTILIILINFIIDFNITKYNYFLKRLLLTFSIIYFIYWILFGKSEDTLQYVIAIICLLVIIFNLILIIIKRIRS